MPEAVATVTAPAPAPAPAVTPTAVMPATGQVVSGDSVTAPVVPALSAEPEPVAPYDISKWDGKVESLPEDIRPLGDGFSRYFQPKLERIGKLESDLADFEHTKSRADEYELLYKALSDGTEDPRIASLTGTVAEREAALATLKAQHEQLVADVQKADTEWAASQWKAFQDQNPVIAKNPAALKTIKELYESGWELNEVPALLEMDAKHADAVRQLVAEGLKPARALELVSLRNANVTPPKPSPASVVSGAEHPTGNPAAMAQGSYRKESYSDRLERVTAKAMR